MDYEYRVDELIDRKRAERLAEEFEGQLLTANQWVELAQTLDNPPSFNERVRGLLEQAEKRKRPYVLGDETIQTMLEILSIDDDVNDLLLDVTQYAESVGFYERFPD